MAKKEEKTPLTEEVKKYYSSFNIIVENEEDIENLIFASNFFKVYKQTVQGILPERTNAYNSIIEELVVFLRQMGITDSLEICNTFSYMMWSGLFSKDSSYGFDIKLSNVLKSLDNFGRPIIRGEGVCLNNSAMLDSVLKQADIPSFLMTNKMNIKGSASYVPKIEMKKKNKFKNKLVMKILASISGKDGGNHACEVVLFNGEYFLYDSTNLLVFPLDESLESIVLNGTYTTSLRPEGSLTLGHLSLEDLPKLKDVYLTHTQRDDAQIMVRDFFERDLDFFRSNMPDFLEFRKSIDGHIDIINDPKNNKIPLIDFVEEFDKVETELGLSLGKK